MSNIDDVIATLRKVAGEKQEEIEALWSRMPAMTKAEHKRWVDAHASVRHPEPSPCLIAEREATRIALLWAVELIEAAVEDESASATSSPAPELVDGPVIHRPPGSAKSSPFEARVLGTAWVEAVVESTDADWPAARDAVTSAGVVALLRKHGIDVTTYTVRREEG